MQGLGVRLRVPQPLAVKEPDAHAEWESDALPLAEPLPDGLTVKLAVDDPQPLIVADAELQGLGVGLRVPKPLAVIEPDAHAERERAHGV